MAAITEAKALQLKKRIPVINNLSRLGKEGYWKFLTNFDDTTGAYTGSIADTDITSITGASFTVDSDNSADVKMKIATNLSANGDYTLTLTPLAGTWGQNSEIYIPDPGGANSTLVLEDLAQTLTNKTIESPVIADFTNANHDHSTAAKGGVISLGLISGTSGDTFSINDGASTPQLDITCAGSTGDFTMTLQVPTIAANRTVTLPAVTCTLASLTGTETLTNKTLTAPVIGTGLTASGSAANDFSGSTGTFKTSTGAVTIGNGAIAVTGDVTVATNKNLVFTAGTGYVQINGATSGAIKILPTGSGTGTTTIQNQASAAATITLPSATGTLAVLGANTFTGAQTFSAAGIFASTVDLQGNVGSSTGNPNVDLSGSSGTFKTPTGAVTLGSGAITVSGTVTVSGNKAFDYSSSTSTFKTSTGTNTIGGATVFAADKGVTVTAGTSAFDFSGGSGIFKTSTGAVTVGPGAIGLTGAVTIAANKNWDVSAGTTAFDLSGGSGIFKTTTGAVTVGPGAVAISGIATLAKEIQLTPGASTAAAGTVTGDATVLPDATSSVYPTTAADDAKGVRIHANDEVTGRVLFIGNGVSNKILKVYPPTGSTINGAAADAAFSTASGKGAILICLNSAAHTWLAW